MSAADQTARRARRFSSARLVLVLGLTGLAGLLIWNKLKLTTTIPQTAYAEPGDTPSLEPAAPPPVELARR